VEQIRETTQKFAGNMEMILANQRQENSEATKQVPPLKTRPVGILVVDDEVPVRALLDTVLRQNGFSVWQAGGGQEALDQYRQNRENIGLVLLDVRMPDLDGVETLAALRGMNPSIQCCFMSGHSGDYSHEQLLELGAARVFAKPFRLAELLQVARQLI